MPTPTITSISPTNLTAGHAGFVLTITGTNYVSGDTVLFGAHSLTPATLTSTTITVNVSAADIAAPGPISVTVKDAGGAVSNAATFTVNPRPTITSISPKGSFPNRTGVVGGVWGQNPFPLIVNGTNYTNTSVVQWAGVDLTTTFISATQLSAVVPVLNLFNAGGTYSIDVITTDGVLSNTKIFSIYWPPPIMYVLNPGSKPAGATGFPFDATHYGDNMFGGSAANWNGARLSSNAVPTGYVATAGLNSVSYTNGNGFLTTGPSNALNFPVY